MTIRTVYALVDPRDSAVRYVGCCLRIRIRRRLFKHYSPDYNRKLIAWVKSLKLLGLRPKQVLLESNVGDNWEDRERHWIKYYRSLGASLVNLTDGGKGPLGSKKSLATRLKHRAFRHSEGTKQRIREAHLGVKFSSSHKMAISIAKKGKPWTHLQRKVMAEVVARNPQCKARYRKGESNGRAVLTESNVHRIRSLHGKLSLTELAVKFGVSVSTIKRVLNRKLWGHI
jgi:hypothetical protein